MPDQSFIFQPCEPGVDLELWGALLGALGGAAHEQGYSLFYKEATGFDRVYLRKVEDD